MTTGRDHALTLPLRRAEVESLRAGDRVVLNGRVTMTIGLSTHRRLVEQLDAGAAVPVDLSDGAFLHLSCYNRESDCEAGHEALYLNPTTSTRYNAFMPRLIEGLGLRLVGGKGGLDAACVAALQRQGCAYLSFLGGGCTPLSAAIRSVASVHFTDEIAQFRLLTLDVNGLGPATVGIDCHGASLYDRLQAQAAQRLPGILAAMKSAREAER